MNKPKSLDDAKLLVAAGQMIAAINEDLSILIHAPTDAQRKINARVMLEKYSPTAKSKADILKSYGLIEEFTALTKAYGALVHVAGS